MALMKKQLQRERNVHSGKLKGVFPVPGGGGLKKMAEYQKSSLTPSRASGSFLFGADPQQISSGHFMDKRLNEMT